MSPHPSAVGAIGKRAVVIRVLVLERTRCIRGESARPGPCGKEGVNVMKNGV